MTVSLCAEDSTGPYRASPFHWKAFFFGLGLLFWPLYMIIWPVSLPPVLSAEQAIWHGRWHEPRLSSFGTAALRCCARELLGTCPSKVQTWSLEKTLSICSPHVPMKFKVYRENLNFIETISVQVNHKCTNHFRDSKKFRDIC